MSDLRKAVVKHLLNEFKSQDKVKEFSNLLRSLNICDLRDDPQLERFATTGAIDTAVAMYQLGILSKLRQLKEIIQGDEQ